MSPYLSLLFPCAGVGLLAVLALLTKLLGARDTRRFYATRGTADQPAAAAPAAPEREALALPAAEPPTVRYDRGEFDVQVLLAHVTADRAGAPARHRLNEDLGTATLPAIPAQRRGPNVRMVNA